MIISLRPFQIFLKQLEQMELDELQCQEQIRQELITAETTHQNLKKDYDKLQVEHQQVRYQPKTFQNPK